MNKPGPDTHLETARLILSPVSDEYKQDICDEFTSELGTRITRIHELLQIFTNLHDQDIEMK
jgi:hypothetical protein